jgi:hypothetical protein
MATNIKGLTQQFQGLELMIKQLLDKMSGFEAWRTKIDESLGTLLTKTLEVAGRIE